MSRMGLVEFDPQELQFVFELKKQSSCSIKLTNICDDYVAFKVKTTSPKRYCVRPNTGIIQPRSTRDFTVTMQAQKEAPPDMQFKDKFLIQSAAVPRGTTDEDIVSSFFSKEKSPYVQENKLRVVLIEPVNGNLNLEQAYSDPAPEVIPKLENKQVPASHTVASETNGSSLKQEITFEDPKSEKNSATSYNSFRPEAAREVPKSEEIFVTSYDDSLKQEAVDKVPTDSGLVKADYSDNSLMSKETILSTDKSSSTYGNIISPLVAKDVEAMKSKLNNLELKLNVAEQKITRLREESSASVIERNNLQQEIALLRKNAVRVQVGFPFLFVVFMALVGLILGYLLRR